MEDYIGKICPYCKTEIKEGDVIKVCPSCGVPHHEACWIENKGCTTSGCAEQYDEEQHTKPIDICVKCGTHLDDGQDFCPKCGTPRGASKKRMCPKCGTELEEDQGFCPKCGTKADAASVPDATTVINQVKVKVDQVLQKGKKVPITIAATAGFVVIAVILIIVLGKSGSNKINFNKLYDEYCAATWASVGSDGSYLSIDTNPYDRSDDGLAYPAAYTAIENVNNAIGLPDSLLKEMSSTTGADGKQTESFDEFGITVSWKYHPDKGLEVTYKKMK